MVQNSLQSAVSGVKLRKYLDFYLERRSGHRELLSALPGQCKSRSCACMRRPSMFWPLQTVIIPRISPAWSPNFWCISWWLPVSRVIIPVTLLRTRVYTFSKQLGGRACLAELFTAVFFFLNQCVSSLMCSSSQKSVGSCHYVRNFKVQLYVPFQATLKITEKFAVFTEHISNYKTVSHCYLGRASVQEKYSKNSTARSLLARILEESHGPRAACSCT